MSKIILTKRISAIFLVIVLIAGAFAISSPLTVYGQQYEQDYQQDYDSSYYQSDPRMNDDHHSDKKGQSANCDNTNVNLNDINQLQRQNQAVGNTIDTAATLNGESLTGEEALNAITGNGDPTGGPLLNLDRNIINICINSNDNTLSGTFDASQGQDAGETGVTCDGCFDRLTPTIQDAIDAFLLSTTGDITISATPNVVIPGSINTIEQLCAFLTVINVTPAQFQLLIQQFDTAIPGVDVTIATALVNCLVEAGVIVQI